MPTSPTPERLPRRRRPTKLAQEQQPSTPDTDQQPADTCAICAVISLAGNVLFASPPLLQLPQAVDFLYLTTDAEFVHLELGPFRVPVPRATRLLTSID